ncbi:NAD-dependent epimerase/dehydratase family protein, partial [Ruegeria sp. HKCCD4318-2]|nr:NAD-dependent epimerase/dehydratase family protein [Ruegeria sp. HKCCD4318-2]
MTPVGSEQLGGTSVLVTGATGFIGKRLVPALLQIGARVTVVLRSRHGAATLKRMGARVVTGSMADRATMETVLRDQDVLFHLAYDMRAT